ncbi:AlpA family phage regulatory protein [Phyllobacterium salinisoli]|uniref:AlpA family phage regulatory protein n=1 Tax=Phyllobacterium salinisoli TaxID=1899321 RepID=A0A368K553_9HYPH|nr:AlpA family phage regulatory protein [Phyllobacterium salinisoli]RCS24516.1 AlpA family phage regulatory protein [Phyllobacterium salinisoli]
MIPDDTQILISINDAARLTSLSRTMINRYRAEGRFPNAVPLGDRRVAFVKTEVVKWISDKIANRQAANDNTTSTPKQDGTVVGHIDGRTMLKPGTLAPSAA